MIRIVFFVLFIVFSLQGCGGDAKQERPFVEEQKQQKTEEVRLEKEGTVLFIPAREIKETKEAERPDYYQYGGYGYPYYRPIGWGGYSCRPYYSRRHYCW